MSAAIDIITALIAGGMHAVDAAALLARAAVEMAVSAQRIPQNSADISAERRREKDRLRKRKTPRIPQNSAEIPQNSSSALSSSSLVIDSEMKQERKKERAQRGRGEKIPQDWTPTAEHYAFGREHDRDRRWIDQQAEDMRIWARTNEHRAVARKSDWNLTFMGWVRRTIGAARSTGPPRKHNPSFAEIAMNAERALHEQPADHEPDFDLGTGPVIEGSAVR